MEVSTLLKRIRRTGTIDCVGMTELIFVNPRVKTIFISRMLSSPYSEANGRHRRQPHEEPPARRRTLSAGSRQ